MLQSILFKLELLIFLGKIMENLKMKIKSYKVKNVHNMQIKGIAAVIE